MAIQFDYQKPYKTRFGTPDDDDPYGEEERGLLGDLSTLPSDDVANRLRIRARLSALRERRADRKQQAADRERSRRPIFQEQQRPTQGVPATGRYRVKIDPDTGAVLDESYLGSVPDVAREEQERRAQERGTRFEFEKGQAEQAAAERAQAGNRSDYRFAVEQGQRAQERGDTLARQARADEAERYRRREYYDRLAQGANFESAQRRQMEVNRQEQAGFQQQANLQREQAAIKYASQLERLLAEPARFWSSIGNNPQQIEAVVNQLVQYNFGGRFDKLIAMLRAGPEQQGQVARPMVRFAGSV